MVVNATFNNISVISWRSVLLVEVPGENHRPATSHWQNITLCCIEYTLLWAGFELVALVVIGTDWIGSKSNYHTITTTTAPMIWIGIVFVFPVFSNTSGTTVPKFYSDPSVDSFPDQILRSRDWTQIKNVKGVTTLMPKRTSFWIKNKRKQPVHNCNQMTDDKYSEEQMVIQGYFWHKNRCISSTLWHSFK